MFLRTIKFHHPSSTVLYLPSLTGLRQRLPDDPLPDPPRDLPSSHLSAATDTPQLGTTRSQTNEPFGPSLHSGRGRRKKNCVLYFQNKNKSSPWKREIG